METPRVRMLMEEAQLLAEELGHDYVGTEHLLAVMIKSESVAGSVLRSSGFEGPIREKLDEYWSSPVYGTLLVDQSGIADANGRPYQVALVADRPGQEMRLHINEEGWPLVLAPEGSQESFVSAPPEVAAIAREWEINRSRQT